MREELLTQGKATMTRGRAGRVGAAILWGGPGALILAILWLGADLGGAPLLFCLLWLIVLIILVCF